MRLTEFGSVGKIPIIQAISISSSVQENESTEGILNEKATGCHTCPYYVMRLKALASGDEPAMKTAMAGCSACMKKKYYHQNSLDRTYGTPAPLNITSICVFLMLHLCSPTSTGVVSDFDISEAAAFLSKCPRSIRNALVSLEEKGYIISTATDETGKRLVVLNGYDKYFAKASSGGRGYIVITDEFVKRLSSIESINSMRLCIREYLAIDDMRIRGYNVDLYNTDSSFRQSASPIRDVRSLLPSYLRPCGIKKAVENCSPLFSTSDEEGIFTFKLEESLFGHDEKIRRTNEAHTILSDEFFEADSIIARSLNYEANILDFNDYIKWIATLPPKERSKIHLTPSDSDMEDLVQMAVQYSVEAVISAVHSVWSSFEHINKHGNIGSYGAKVRNIIQEMQSAA